VLKHKRTSPKSRVSCPMQQPMSSNGMFDTATYLATNLICAGFELLHVKAHSTTKSMLEQLDKVCTCLVLLFVSRFRKY
jgi:hypothetical protein